MKYAIKNPGNVCIAGYVLAIVLTSIGAAFDWSLWALIPAGVSFLIAITAALVDTEIIK